MERESLGQLVQDIVDDVRQLFREEVALARAEIREEVGVWSSAASNMAAGAAAAALAGVFLLLAIAQGIALLFGWPAAAGYLVVAVILGAFGWAAIRSGRRRAKSAATLPRTTETVKETSTWLKDRMSSRAQ
jgi:uncharacterized membrane protein